ncbi:MAG: carbon-nitrogen hydrolase family protein, partial [Candidatus Hydrogenedentes bacterium]|nr:carbon-nitrogen hydrolase family protein [Candidatus Hydrogenedentota bacterium]
AVASASPSDRQDRPGRIVKVSAICIGCGGAHDAKLKLALEHLETSGAKGVDLACLPEMFAGDQKTEPISGPTVNAVAEIARKHHMYVICPIREQDGDKVYNTAVLIDREGHTAGYYRKIFVFWAERNHAGKEGVKTFDTDFGRIAIFTCFDLNFPELWREADEQNVDVVFWPSAYGGGRLLNAFASLYNYAIVPVGWGNITDQTGKTVAPMDNPRPDQYVAELNLDQTFVHLDFTHEKVKRLMEEHPGEILLDDETYRMEGWHFLKALKPGVRVRDLLPKYDIPTLREYRHLSRTLINEAREKELPISLDLPGAPKP